MTYRATPVSLLVDEVNGLLSASSVGLYEFVWLLRSSMPSISDEQRREYAREALRLILAQGGRRLILLEWPGEAELGEATFDDLADQAWEDPTDGTPYAAVVRC